MISEEAESLECRPCTEESDRELDLSKIDPVMSCFPTDGKSFSAGFTCVPVKKKEAPDGNK